MVTNEDRTLAIVGYYRVLNGVNQPYSHVRLQGLNPDMIYENVWNHTENYGDELMNYGLITSDATAGEVPGNVTPCTDFESRIYINKGRKADFSSFSPIIIIEESNLHPPPYDIDIIFFKDISGQIHILSLSVKHHCFIRF